jgi:DNA segregation ATPase FtsK/SpoIIIE, S-DNA-T family
MGRRGGRSAASRGKRAGVAARLRGALSGFLLGREVDEATGQRLREIEGLCFIAFSAWLLVSMLSFYAPYHDPRAAGRNWGGQAGWYLANAGFLFFGWAGYAVALLSLAWGLVIVARKGVTLFFLRLLGGLCFVLSASFLLELGLGMSAADGAGGYQALGSRLPYGPGGWLALQATPFLVAKFGGVGLWILLVLLALVSFLLATDKAFYPAIAALDQWLEERREKRGQGLVAALASWCAGLARGLWDFVRGADLARADAAAAAQAAGGGRARRAPAPEPSAEAEDDEEYEDEELDGDDDLEDEELEDDDEEDEDDEDDDEEEEDDEEDEEEEDEEDAYDRQKEGEPERELVPAAAARKPAVGRASLPAYEPPTPPKGPWTFPPLDLLEAGVADSGADERFLETSAAKLENALRSFRVESEVVSAQVGPAVTLFELTVAEGTRMNKVTQLSQEIAAALRAQSVRIIAPIPGRATIGIEVPNATRRIVRLRELIHGRAYDPKFMALPLFLGMDAEGTPIIEDLARMPHLLIAGTTGSGKSVCINTILASLLLTRSPHDVKMILIDPKMVELQLFSRVPHLMLPVVTDTRQATNVLLWAVEKMEGRYDLFRSAGVKNIKTYNALGEDALQERLGEDWDDERTPRHLPYVVVVIDEMADLMMTSKKEAELAITRLAQKSRAVGIHVIVATQRPSTDVITGVIKGNLPTRIAFQVASKVDSRVILDHVGAEKLLGGGDMLYTPPQSSQLRRVQGALVEDKEIQVLVDFVCESSAPAFDQELVQTATGTAPGGGLSASDPEDDPMWDEAVRVILKSRRGSASLLQRALGVGYTRASRLIDMMTEQGIVGEHKGSKAREVLLTLEDWENTHGSPLGQGASDG